MMLRNKNCTNSQPNVIYLYGLSLLPTNLAICACHRRKQKKVKPVSSEIRKSRIEIERSSPPGIKECAGIVSRDVTNKSGGRELLTFYCLNYLERDPRGS